MEQQKKQRSENTPFLKITLSLLIICTVCASLLGVSFLVTAKPIADNEQEAINSILVALFNDTCTFEKVQVPENENATAAWRVLAPSGALVGYAVRAMTPGFSDDIDLIVGFDAACAIQKIEIVSISETAGLGSRVGEQDYLSNYTGKSGTSLSLNQDVDAITGATKSSKALLRGVNSALSCVSVLAK